MSAAIEVRDIVKKFGDFTAVNGISFTVNEGEVFGLLGPNGAGKSTLIRMLVTLLPPSSGTALVNGFDVVRKADDVRRSIGVIPQAMTSDLELSVEETYMDRVKIGDKMRVRLPSGEERDGTIFYRGVDASFATQRDVSRTKRDIKTFEIRLRVDNSDRRLAVGMTAYVELPVI